MIQTSEQNITGISKEITVNKPDELKTACSQHEIRPGQRSESFKKYATAAVGAISLIVMGVLPEKVSAIPRIPPPPSISETSIPYGDKPAATMTPTPKLTRTPEAVPTVPIISSESTRSLANTGYTVLRGDTLGKIAARYEFTIQDFMKANGITNPNLLKTGQKLVIPQKTDKIPSSSQSKQPTANSKEIQPLAPIIPADGTAEESPYAVVSAQANKTTPAETTLIPKSAENKPSVTKSSENLLQVGDIIGSNTMNEVRSPKISLKLSRIFFANMLIGYKKAANKELNNDKEWIPSEQEKQSITDKEFTVEIPFRAGPDFNFIEQIGPLRTSSGYLVYEYIDNKGIKHKDPIQADGVCHSASQLYEVLMQAKKKYPYIKLNVPVYHWEVGPINGVPMYSQISIADTDPRQNLIATNYGNHDLKFVVKFDPKTQNVTVDVVVAK